jgi:hypothetical protein
MFMFMYNNNARYKNVASCFVSFLVQFDIHIYLSPDRQSVCKINLTYLLRVAKSFLRA